MVAFFCATPYQILLASHLAYTELKEKKVDIYVLNHFNNAKEILERLSRFSLFHKVVYVDCVEFTRSFSTNRLIRFMQKIGAYVSYKKVAKNVLHYQQEAYGDVYFSFPDVIIQLGLKAIYDNNKQVKIHLFEDGLGGYTPNNQRVSSFKTVFNAITQSSNILDRYDFLHVFKPELMYETNIPIRKIEPIDRSDTKFREIVNHVFGYSDSDKIKERIVFFEQPMPFFTGMDEAVANIVCPLLKSDYTVKLHPRSLSERYNACNIYKNNGIPWEVICMNCEIENKVLIAYSSTAVISAKMLFDKEPTIIYLFNLPEILRYGDINNHMRAFINKFKQTYSQPEKVMTPKTVEEIQSIITFEKE